MADAQPTMLPDMTQGQVNQGPIAVTFKDSQGQEQTATAGQIYQQLQQNGYQVSGISADGTTFHFADPRGDFTMTAQDVLKNLGHEVQHVMPTDPDESKINFGYRAAISRLPDDDAKKAYLEAKLKREGVDTPNVVGKGRDWSYFDPQTNHWHALTNSQHWDASDLVEAGLEGIHGLGAGIGGVLGGGAGATALGVGAIPGAMAGSAAGGALAETGIRGALNYLDPEYAKMTTLGGQAKDIGIGAGLDAGLVGVGGIAGKALGRLGGPAAEEGLKRLAVTGPVSTAAKGVGKATEAAGSLLGMGGQVTKSPLARDVIAGFTPGLGQAQMASMALQAPEYLATVAAKLARGAAGSSAAESMLGKEAAQGLQQGTEEVLTKAAPKGIAERWNTLFRGKAADAPEIRASDLGGNLGEKIGQKFGAAEEGVMQAKNIGQKAGKVTEDLATVGRTIEKGIHGTIRGAGMAAEGVGGVLKGAGKGLHTAGQVAQPFEYIGGGGAYLRDLEGQKLRDLLMQRERKALQQRLKQSTMETTTAEN